MTSTDTADPPTGQTDSMTARTANWDAVTTRPERNARISEEIHAAARAIAERREQALASLLSRR